jgi:hypothetical protein
MTRHWKLVSITAGVLVLAGLGAGLAIGLSGSTTNRAAASPGLGASQQARLEKEITAPTVTAQAAVVAAEVRSQFMSQRQPLLSPGSRLSISSATFRAVSAQMATVDATVTGAQAGHWRLVLVREGGRWLLIGTRKLS